MRHRGGGARLDRARVDQIQRQRVDVVALCAQLGRRGLRELGAQVGDDDPRTRGGGGFGEGPGPGRARRR